MAETNRNRKLWLNGAWKHYWSVLFPNGVDWCSDLESGIRRRLYFPGEASGFPSGLEPDPQPPSWAGDLDVGFQDNLATVSFRGTGLGAVPLFANSPFQVVANWQNSNPFESVGDRTAVNGRNRENCRAFLIAAVRDCGNRIQNHLLCVLQEIKQPKCQITTGQVVTPSPTTNDS